MSAISSNVAARIKQARRHSGFRSAARAARALGVGRSTYSAWENGQNGINVHVAKLMAEVFDVRWEWLLTGEGEMEIGRAAEDMAMVATPAPSPVISSPVPDLIGFADSLIKYIQAPGNEPKSRPVGQDSDVVIPAQHEIEVYENSSGAVVLKMDAGGIYDEDQVVIIRPEHVDAVVATMLRVKAGVMG